VKLEESIAIKERKVNAKERYYRKEDGKRSLEGRTSGKHFSTNSEVEDFTHSGLLLITKKPENAYLKSA
jgi:hypothetical protein